jgi:hypothetical protein
MPSPPSTRPSGSRGRRSSAFVRKDPRAASRSAVPGCSSRMTPISRGFGGHPPRRSICRGSRGRAGAQGSLHRSLFGARR